MNIADRFQRGWAAFFGRDPTDEKANYNEPYNPYWALTSSGKPDRVEYIQGNERTIVTTVINRIALDVSSISFRHVKTDEDNNFKEFYESYLDDCLNYSANIDQTGKQLIRDAVTVMCERGVCAIVPTWTDDEPTDKSASYDILEMRVGRVMEWQPNRVLVRVYDDTTGEYRERYWSKANAAIIENPFYPVMNAPNGTLQKLIRLQKQLDLDHAKGNKLDLLIQLPFVNRNNLQDKRAEKRKKDIESQLNQGTLGIAYLNAEEKVTQLNRAVDNNIWTEIQNLKSEIYSQLGLSQAIFDGTATEDQLNQYYNRTVEVYCDSIVEELSRKFITKTARTQGQTIMYFRDSFKLIPISQIPDLADKLTRNAILSTNEMRVKIGFRPSDQEDANTLRNKNLNLSDNDIANGGEAPTGDADNTTEPTGFKRQAKAQAKKYLEKEET